MSTLLSTTPRADGFRMPGATERKKRCWMIWPERTDGGGWRQAGPARVCAGCCCNSDQRSGYDVRIATAVQECSCDVARTHSRCRNVNRRRMDARLRSNFVVNDSTGEVRGVDWIFNAWGGLESGAYFPWDADDLVARKVLDIEELDRDPRPHCGRGAVRSSATVRERSSRHSNAYSIRIAR